MNLYKRGIIHDCFIGTPELCFHACNRNADFCVNKNVFNPFTNHTTAPGMKNNIVRSTLILAVILTAVFFAFDSCKKDDTASDTTTPTVCDSSGTVSYAGKIQPVLNTKCGANNTACHNASNALSSGGSSGSLADYSGTIETINDRGTTDFIQRITHDPAMASSKYMPKGAGKLDDCNIAKLTNWINQGMLNN